MVTPAEHRGAPRRRGRAGTARPRPAPGRRPSTRTRSGRRGRSRPRSSAPRRRTTRGSSGVSVPSASSSAKPRSTAITAPPPRRGRSAAATSPTCRRPTVPSAASEQDVAGEHVHPAQPAPPRRPDGALGVVGDRVGHLLGAHVVGQRAPASPSSSRRRRRARAPRARAPPPRPRPPGRGPRPPPWPRRRRGTRRRPARRGRAVPRALAFTFSKMLMRSSSRRSAAGEGGQDVHHRPG